ncbi:UNVERIFIED_ORG: hypothetical protein FHU00_0846 [Citrobacter freundii]
MAGATLKRPMGLDRMECRVQRIQRAGEIVFTRHFKHLHALLSTTVLMDVFFFEYPHKFIVVMPVW